jgi:hypothetical protein
MSVIRDCGTECAPKSFAFAQSSLFYEHGNIPDAIRWAEIVDVIDVLLHDVAKLGHIPRTLH